MSANFCEAENKAKEVISKNFITAPPILAEKLAKNYGLTVKYAIFKEEYSNISGFIVPLSTDNKVCQIIVNAAEHPNRQNFTIAHELGHFLLQHVGKPDYEVLYRRPIGDSNTKELEQAANCFAANLLVPKQMLEEYIKKYPLITNEQLASIFGVSTEVIGYRRNNLSQGK